MIYYVSASKTSSGMGTFSNPFSSLQKAHDLAKPGDVIQLRGGTYNLIQGLKFTNDGTADKPITVENYNNEKVIIDAGKTTGGFALKLNSASYNHIKGLEIKNGIEGGVGVTGASNGNKFELLNIHHNGRMSEYDGKGFVIYGSSANNLVLNVDSHDNRDLAGSNADGFQIATTGTGNVVRGCRAWNNADDGFDLFNVQNNTAAGAVTLDSNYAWHNGYNTSGAWAGDGNGFKLGGVRSGTTGISGGHTVVNNVAFDNPYAGFSDNGAQAPLKLYNNTSYGNGYSFEFYSNQHVLKNNLSVGGKLWGVGDHNSWNGGVTANSADFQSTLPGTVTGIRNADGTVKSGTFLHLVAGSDLIDKGINVGIKYNGTAPDLGAFETAGTTTVAIASALATTAPPQQSSRMAQDIDKADSSAVTKYENLQTILDAVEDFMRIEGFAWRDHYASIVTEQPGLPSPGLHDFLL